MTTTTPSPERPDPFELVERIGRGTLTSLHEARVVGEEARRFYGCERVVVRIPHSPKNGRRIRERLTSSSWRGQYELADRSTAPVRRYLGFERTRDSLCIVFESVDGNSLRDRLGHHRTPMGVSDALRIAADVLAALAALHAAGLTHGAVKPENVLFDGSSTKLDLPFNHPDDRDPNDPMTDLLLYLSPEQIAAPSQPSPGSDLWQCGVMLYEMLTGLYPFGDPRSHTVVFIAAIRERREVSARAANPAIPPFLDAVVGRALAPDPGDRYASAEEMRRAIEGVQEPARPGIGTLQ